MQCRLASAADDASVGELLVTSFIEQYAKKLPEVVVTPGRQAELRAVAAKRAEAKVWVAVDEGQVVGTVALWPPGAPRSEAWKPRAFDLRHLAVAASHRGRGVSSALLDAAEQYARGEGGDFVCLHVRRKAEGVAALYVARGYRRAPEGDLELPEVALEAYELPVR